MVVGGKDGECFVGDMPALEGGKGDGLCTDLFSEKPGLNCGVVNGPGSMFAPGDCALD